MAVPGPGGGAVVTGRHVLCGQLELDEEGQMIGGDVGVGAAQDLVVVEPLLVERTQQTQWIHELARVEYVVYHTFEVKPTKT